MGLRRLHLLLADQPFRVNSFMICAYSRHSSGANSPFCNRLSFFFQTAGFCCLLLPVSVDDLRFFDTVMDVKAVRRMGTGYERRMLLLVGIC